jgi:hypothetical protein
MARTANDERHFDREQGDPAINDWLLTLTDYCRPVWRAATAELASVHDFRLRKAVQPRTAGVRAVDLDRSRSGLS